MPKINQNQTIQKQPLASIIILTYNSEKYIEQTLDSIICQNTTFLYQIVISDDFSIDSTRNILRSYGEKHENIKILFNQKNLGIIANFKHAIDYSIGKYIAFCGHDDFWHDKEKLQKQVNFLEKNQDFGLIHSDYNIFNEITKKTIFNVHKLNKNPVNQGFVTDDLIYNYNINSCTPCFRKDIFEKHVPINDFIRLKFPVEDWATYIIISINSKVGYINDSTGTFRIGHESASNIANFSKAEYYLERHEIMFDYLRNRYKNEFSKFGKDDFKVYKSINLLSAAYKSNLYLQAFKHAHILTDFNQNNLKIFCAKNIILFKIYIVLKKIYNLIKK